jgi:hypothetical protein
MPVLIRKLVGASSSVVILFAKTFLRIAYENLLDKTSKVIYFDATLEDRFSNYCNRVVVGFSTGGSVINLSTLNVYAS